MNIIKNTYKRDVPADVSWLYGVAAEHVKCFHQSVPGYSPTPLRNLNRLAREVDVGSISVKDESARFGLKAFKGLGSIYALAMEVANLTGCQADNLRFPELQTPEIQEKLKNVVFATATDGNHGKGVAWAANLLGCEARVYMPAGSSSMRAQAIRDAGRAQVTITEYSYDDTVKEVSRLAREYGWRLVQDTSWDGYEEVPKHIMQGYTTMVRETVEKMEDPPTHVFLQAGVGAMAGAATGYLAAHYGAQRPVIVLVEPYAAACIYESMEAGDMRTARGDGCTIMAGLNCGTPCSVAWPVLRDYGDFAVVCEDAYAKLGMRRLAEEGVISGESGAAATGAFLRIAEASEMRGKLGINGDSRILLFNTEGDTDPVSYREIIKGPEGRKAGVI